MCLLMTVRIIVCRRESDDADCDFLNRIVAVAEPVPFGMFGLNSARTVRCTRTQHSWPGSVDARHQLPALPRLPARFADQVGPMPSAARVDFDPFNRSHARPGDTSNRDVAALDFRALVWFGDERPYPQSCDGFARVLTAASPFVPIFFHLKVTGERLFDQFDVSEPLDRRDRVPTWHDESQRETMMDRQWLAIHDISKDRSGVTRLVKPQTAFIVDRA